MFEMLKIEKRIINNESQNSINGRDLWRELGVKREFANWMPENLKMFSARRDYQAFDVDVKNLKGGRPRQEYALTLDTAKHIALVSRTEKGKEIRDYFIEAEKKAKALYSKEDKTWILSDPAIYAKWLGSIEKAFSVAKKVATGLGLPEYMAIKKADRLVLDALGSSPMLLLGLDDDFIDRISEGYIAAQGLYSFLARSLRSKDKRLSVPAAGGIVRQSLLVRHRAYRTIREATNAIELAVKCGYAYWADDDKTSIYFSPKFMMEQRKG